MMNSGLNFGFPLFLALHFLSVLVFFFGILFLVFWAFKSLSGADLWKWGWILVTAAVILCLLSIIAAPLRGFSRHGFDGMKMKWTSGCSAGDRPVMPMMDGFDSVIDAEEDVSAGMQDRTMNMMKK